MILPVGERGRKKGAEKRSACDVAIERGKRASSLEVLACRLSEATKRGKGIAQSAAPCLYGKENGSGRPRDAWPSAGVRKGKKTADSAAPDRPWGLLPCLHWRKKWPRRSREGTWPVPTLRFIWKREKKKGKTLRNALAFGRTGEIAAVCVIPSGATAMEGGKKKSAGDGWPFEKRWRNRYASASPERREKRPWDSCLQRMSKKKILHAIIFPLFLKKEKKGTGAVATPMTASPKWRTED